MNEQSTAMVDLEVTAPSDENGSSDRGESQGTPGESPEDVPPPTAATVSYRASIYPREDISSALGEALDDLSAAMNGMPVWLLVQGGQAPYAVSFITEFIAHQLFLSRHEQTKNEPVLLVIHSPGGDADAAYRIATSFQKQCGGFTAVIPRMAKSAATLLALGGNDIVLGEYGELGPLDVQIVRDPEDPMPERESALNEVEAVQRLHSDALAAIDNAVLLLLPRLGKKPEVVLPHAINVVSQTMRPLMERIDTNQYTKRSRELKIGEDYGARLLANRYPWPVASRIAQKLVVGYADHGFIIDRDETVRIVDQLEDDFSVPVAPLAADLPDEVCHILNRLVPLMSGVTAIGRLTRVETNDGEDNEVVS